MLRTYTVKLSKACCKNTIRLRKEYTVKLGKCVEGYLSTVGKMCCVTSVQLGECVVGVHPTEGETWFGCTTLAISCIVYSGGRVVVI